MSISRLNPGYQQEPPAGRVIDAKIYIGIVKNNVDVQNMGRLQVWIPEIGGDPNDEKHWFLVGYASPFAGATNPYGTVKDGKNYGQSQESYGFWMVPPDLNNEVLVAFVNGEATRGFWIGCLFQQYMTHMVPGIPNNLSTEPNNGGHCGALGTVTEYNKWDSAVKPPDPPRPPFQPLNDGLCKEGLFADPVRGPSSSGSRRESPSKVFGIKTPRGSHFVMDDLESNEFIRLRTRGGTQILVHETNGFVYINSKQGNSWLEISEQGIDMFSTGNISIRAQKDINLHADGEVNINSGSGINANSETDVKIASTGSSNIVAGKGIFATSSAGIDLKGSDAINLTSDANVGISGLSLQLQATTTIAEKATMKITRSALLILDNVESITDIAPATAGSTKEPKTQADIKMTPGNCCGGSATVKSVVSRMPTHEPFAGHPKSGSAPARVVHPVMIVTDTIVNKDGNEGAGGGPVIKTTPGEGTTPGSTSTTVTTGSGATKVVPADPNSFQSVSVGKYKIRQDVLDAIREGADDSGARFGCLMAICQVESNFNPNAKAGTSSASGLFQFTDGTWTTMINTKDATRKTYGELFGIGAGDKLDPRASSIIGGLFTMQNSKYLQSRIGRDPSDTDLYMAHFLGAGGAVKFLTADTNASAAAVMGPSAANANKSIFYDANNNPRTVADVYARFQAKVEPMSIAFSQAFPSAGV